MNKVSGNAVLDGAQGTAGLLVINSAVAAVQTGIRIPECSVHTVQFAGCDYGMPHGIGLVDTVRADKDMQTMGDIGAGDCFVALVFGAGGIGIIERAEVVGEFAHQDDVVILVSKVINLVERCASEMNTVGTLRQTSGLCVRVIAGNISRESAVIELDAVLVLNDGANSAS